MIRCRPAVLAASAIALGILSGCNNGAPNQNSEAFTGPLSNDLIVDTGDTECPTGRIGPGDTVEISGFDYLPESLVELRWTVPSENTTGTWPPVTADEDGDFSASLKIGRAIASPGDEVLINSEGTGQTGLMVLSTHLEVSAC
ncbi:MAG TPA: hypothetical protein VFX15_00575 [Actinomycetes bacterium]|nr:hypothetical protein [Actinomycetes bacterium]